MRKYSHLKYGTVRSWIFNAKRNGLEDSGAIKRVGRSIYMDEDKFMKWVLNHNE